MRAGRAVREISPRESVFLVGFPHVQRMSEGVHDPLLASALYLTNERTAVLLVALDLLFIDPVTARELRRRISAVTGVSETAVFVSCSHTHSGPNTCDVLEWGPSPVVPPVDPAYMRTLMSEVTETAAEAVRHPREVDMAWTSALADGVGGNRHDPVGGLSDPEAGILAVRDSASRELFALSMVYSMHPTVLHEDSKLVSSDFPHYTRAFLRERIHPDLTVLYHTGPEGDQSPRYHVKTNSFEEAQRIGTLLGRAVWDRLRELTDRDFAGDAMLDARLVPVVLPRRRLPSVAQARRDVERFRRVYGDLKRKGAARGPVRTAECDVFGAEETLYLAECQENGHLAEVLARYTPIDVQVLRIGEVCLAGFPGELFVEFGLETKRRAVRKCFPVTLVNGELQGYVVTEDAVARGLYEANNRVFAPQAGEIMVQAALQLMQQT